MAIIPACRATERSVRPGTPLNQTGGCPLREGLLLLLVSLGSLLAVCPTSGQIEPDTLEVGLVRHLQAAREAAGRSPLERRPVLDRAADLRAQQIAGLPPDHRRMAAPNNLRGILAQAGATPYRRAAEHLDMKKGYPDPLPYLARTWENSGQPWRMVTGEGSDAFGLAVHETGDGWTLFVAIVLQDVMGHEDLRSLEHRAFEAVNRIRSQRGLSPLKAMGDLSAVARAHSVDMAEREYFDHRSPEGGLPSDRVKEAGIPFFRVAENIQYNYNAPEPVENAVQSWMESPAHRANILSSDFTHTGLGVASDVRGGLYFTQLFLHPPR